LREYILSLNLLLNVKVKVEPEAITEWTFRSAFKASESYFVIVKPNPHPSLLKPLGLSNI
jgi:hypothetical protein